MSADQLVVLREMNGGHAPLHIGSDRDIQGTIRLHPDAFLATSVLVCEGASEVGLVRGLDQYRTTQGRPSIFACGVALVDAGGEKKLLKVANTFLTLRYRVAILRDDDVPPDAVGEKSFADGGARVFLWQPGRGLEQELFHSLPEAAITGLVNRALAVKDEAVVRAQLTSASANAVTLDRVRAELAAGSLSAEAREALAKASSGKNAPWFKSVGAMEEIGRNVVGPALSEVDEDFRRIVGALFDWATDG